MLRKSIIINLISQFIDFFQKTFFMEILDKIEYFLEETRKEMRLYPQYDN
jgi:hypothetical protein